MDIKWTSDIRLINLGVCVFGYAGAGKTTLIRTADKPIILSAEGGLLSLKDSELPYIGIRGIDDLRQVFKWLNDSPEAKQFNWVALDSISEIAEQCLTSLKKIHSNQLRAYGELFDIMMPLMKGFRDLPNHNVYMSAKCKHRGEGVEMLPSMPGGKLGDELGFIFDVVCALTTTRDEDSEEPRRVLQTVNDDRWFGCKTRSQALDFYEEPDLEKLRTKILGAN